MFFCCDDDFENIRSFGLSLGEKINIALQKCGYENQRIGFGSKPDNRVSIVPYSVEPNETIFACMGFLEAFDGATKEVKKFKEAPVGDGTSILTCYVLKKNCL